MKMKGFILQQGPQGISSRCNREAKEVIELVSYMNDISRLLDLLTVN